MLYPVELGVLAGVSPAERANLAGVRADVNPVQRVARALFHDAAKPEPPSGSRGPVGFVHSIARPARKLAGPLQFDIRSHRLRSRGRETPPRRNNFPVVLAFILIPNAFAPRELTLRTRRSETHLENSP